MADLSLNFIIEGAIGIGLAVIGGFAKREFGRMDDHFKTIFAKLDGKVDLSRCDERRSNCDPCRKNVRGILETQDEIINCVNKNVDDCEVKVHR